jgi:multicomponent Na+:H+ antiporter subunit E
MRVAKFERKPMPQRLVLFGVCFIFWCLLAWPMTTPAGEMAWSEVGAGVVVALFAALVMKEIVRVNFVRFVNPRSWFWGFVYIFVFLYYVVRGGLDVAYRVLNPAMPIRPGVVRVRTRLTTDTGRTALANSITLTPGTLTLDVSADGVFYVHWLFVQTTEEEAAAEQVLRRFEWFIERIFE